MGLAGGIKETVKFLLMKNATYWLEIKRSIFSRVVYFYLEFQTYSRFSRTVIDYEFHPFLYTWRLVFY